jgi:hypothetical protein
MLRTSGRARPPVPRPRDSGARGEPHRSLRCAALQGARYAIPRHDGGGWTRRPGPAARGFLYEHTGRDAFNDNDTIFNRQTIVSASKMGDGYLGLITIAVKP